MGMKIRKIRQSAGLIATVIDALTSTSKTDALSANQGRLLNQNKLDKSGGNITGSLILEKGFTSYESTTISKSSGSAYHIAKRTDTDTEVWFGVGSGGVNHGIYTKLLNNWLIWSDNIYGYLLGNIKFDTSGNLTVPGKVTCPTFDGTATKATTATNLNGGTFRTRRSFLFTLDALNNSGRFYKLVTIPVTSDGNAIQINIRGSLGNWTESKATVNIQISNRFNLHVDGTYIGNADAFNYQRIVIYKNSDGSHTVYLYNASSYTGPNTLEITWGGFNIYPTIHTDYSYTTTPSGTHVYSTTVDNQGKGNGPVILYNNATGTTGTITLAESAANFAYLEIFYSQYADGTHITSSKIHSPNGKTGRLCSFGSTYLYYSDIAISGTSVTRPSYTKITISNGGTSSTNEITIYKILGYK